MRWAEISGRRVVVSVRLMMFVVEVVGVVCSNLLVYERDF